MERAKLLLKQSVEAAFLRKPFFTNSLALSNFRNYRHTIKAIEIEFVDDVKLGKAGETVCMPLDNVIMPAVLGSGQWEPEVVDFVKTSVDPNAVYDLIDVGANCGLFARQLLRSGIQIRTAVCIEADPDNYACLRKNLSGYPETSLFNLGLGDTDATLQFFKDRRNHGNYSFIKIACGPDAMLDNQYTVADVDMRDTETFFGNMLGTFGDRLIWKSDTQGFDEIIVARMPIDLWQRVGCAIIELTRVKKPAYSKEAFAVRLASFKTMRLGSTSVSADDVMTFLDSEDGRHEDLFLVR